MDANGNPLASAGSTSFADVVAYVVGLLNSIVWILATLAVLLFMWGVFQYIYSAGAKKNRKILTWGLVALFLLFSLWGVLRLACNSFLGGSACGASTAPLNVVPGQYQTGAGSPSPGVPGGTGALY